jgi:hypothetical protein
MLRTGEIDVNEVYALTARTAGRSAGVGRRNALAGTVTTATVAGHVEELDGIPLLRCAPYDVVLDERANVSGAQAVFGDVAGGARSRPRLTVSL